MTPRALLFFLLVSFVSLLSGSVVAQTITVNTKTIGRGPTHDTKNLAPTDINYADCVNTDYMDVGITTSGVTSGQGLQVWGGTEEGCGTAAGRITLGNLCWQVYVNSVVPTGNIRLAVQDIIPHAGATGMASDCESMKQSTFTLRFILFNGDTQSTAAPAVVNGKYDLKGPAAPTAKDIGIGDGRLYPTWDASNDDPRGYRIFCEEADPNGGSCAGVKLIPGMAPPTDVKESAQATQYATEGVVEGLTNFTPYACAIGTIDQLMNVGPLSELVCATPQPVNGYFKAYRSAGGQGGGGYCAFARGSSGRTAFVAAVGLAAVVFAMRRRRRGGRP